MEILTIKDFAPGDKAYTLEMHTGQQIAGKPIPPDISETSIVSVGRKYLQTTNDEKYQNADREYLRESVSFGQGKMLFRTNEELNNFLEKTEIAKWLGNISVTKAERYSLEQLREVRRILK